MRLLLADDHALVRDGMRRILQAHHTGVEVVEAASLAQVKAQLDANRPFDLLLLDFTMPGVGDVAVIGELASQLTTKTALIIVSGHDEEALIRQCIAAGANGFIPKTQNTQQLLAALTIVLEGGVYLPPQVMQGRRHAKSNPLTTRQQQVLRCLAQGLSSKGIGQELEITTGTVKQHLFTIYQRLKVHNRAQAVLKAIRLGLTE
ncbi:MAG: response regulator transcription factor [Mariprofundales bacterium]|nr:response regulator transcription factor [Mariprofundales bacterium]